jgi:hypothetical protein
MCFMQWAMGQGVRPYVRCCTVTCSIAAHALAAILRCCCNGGESLALEVVVLYTNTSMPVAIGGESLALEVVYNKVRTLRLLLK